MRPFILGTRGSSLAMCQAQIVQTKLEERVPGRTVTIQPIKAQADRNPELPLVAMGGEGVFVKELETALDEHRIDFAVHSMKDLPLAIPASLRIAAVLERDEPRDALVSRSGQALDELPAGSRIGTSSLRRQSQLRHRRSDLQMMEIRGNVDTRLRKLDEGRYDAIVLAACGLKRLGLAARITECFGYDVMVPEPGQGALAIEIRADDAEAREVVRAMHDPTSTACVEAERAFLGALGGGCRVPIAAYDEAHGATLVLRGAVIALDGARKIEDRIAGSMDDAVTLGRTLGERVLKSGARELLR